MKHYSLMNGDRVPGLGLGTWKSKPGEVGAAVETAVRLGYRHLDCAAIYGNEQEIGEAIARLVGDGEVSRDDLWITSKLWNDAHEPARVRPALEKTLADLALPSIDLYLMHWPVALKPGGIGRTAADYFGLDEVPLAETWRALEACRRDGLCRHLGVSNFSAKKLDELLAGAAVPPVMNQVEMHPFLAQAELVRFCRERDVLVTAYSPLGSPDRPPSMRQDDEPSLLAHPDVVGVADRHDATAAQVLIAWALHRDTLVIPKSVNRHRLRENLAAASLTLSSADMSTLDALDVHRRYVEGRFWIVEGGPYDLASLWDE